MTSVRQGPGAARYSSPGPQADPPMPTVRLRFDLGYDGTHFHGWAVQPGLRTVQGVLRHWLDTVLRTSTPVRLAVAGRTDAGVHARGQVVHADLPPGIDPAGLCHRLSRVLPPDVVVHRVSRAPQGFDARFAAIWRRYVYRLWDEDSAPDPLARHETVRVSGHLDTELMNAAGRRLLGLRDFAAFSKPREGASTIRTLQQCEARRRDDPCRGVELTVRADAFCHSMVRSLAGALVAVGTRRRPLEWLDEVAASAVRHGEVRVMPAAGLCLEEVGYPPDEQLALRAALARTMRTPDELAKLQPAGPRVDGGGDEG